jgi:MscS family membrane protein
MMIPRDFINQEFLGNTVENYLWFFGILIFGLVFRRLLSLLLSRLIFGMVHQMTEGVTEEDFKRLLIKPLELFTFLVFLWLAFNRLDVPLEVEEGPGREGLFGGIIFQRVYAFFMIASLAWIVLRLVDFVSLIFRYRASKTTSKLDDQLVPFFTDFVKVLVFIGFFLIMMAWVFNRDVTALIAGLGIGGLALAFAAKESLENLLASFTIFLDQPFTVGDLVQSGEIIGVVEKIGFRSTRIRTLEKSFVTVPNKHMIDKPLDNLTLRTFRRSRSEVNLTYGTTSGQIRAIITQIQTYLDEHPRTNQDGLVKFLRLGSHSKDILVQYFVDTVDFVEFLSVQEDINFKIIEIVEQNGSDFAFPTTTVHLQNEVSDAPASSLTPS